MVGFDLPIHERRVRFTAEEFRILVVFYGVLLDFLYVLKNSSMYAGR